MKLAKTTATSILMLPQALGLCLLVEGTLSAPADLEVLPAALRPRVIIADACDAHLERLLNERGCAVVNALDPVDSLPDGAEITLDLIAGVLGDSSSGREFAMRALPRKHVEFIKASGTSHITEVRGA